MFFFKPLDSFFFFNSYFEGPVLKFSLPLPLWILIVGYHFFFFLISGNFLWDYGIEYLPFFFLCFLSIKFYSGRQLICGSASSFEFCFQGFGGFGWGRF